MVSKRRSDLRKLQSRSTRSEGTMLVAITKDKKSRPKSDLISKPERKSVGCAIFESRESVNEKSNQNVD